jgi:pilus assembly protein FimV
MAHCLPRSLTAVLLALLAATGACAVELGDARVSSYVGQQLVADIELTALENPAGQVQIRLAHPDVYHGANIAMPVVLSSLNMAVMQRDGKQYLHLTSLKPVDADHLHLYLELVEGTHRSVRLSTLWLGADPNPAPPVPTVAPVREEVPALAPARTRQPASAPAPAPERASPPAPTIVRAAPAQAAAKPLPARFAAPVHHLPLAEKPAPAACTPQPDNEARACIALDSKNAALRVQLAQLEKKVQVLQVSMHGGSTPPAAVKPAGAAPAAASKPAVPAGPAPILPQKRRKPVQAEPDPGLPWLAIGIGSGALLALAGALTWVVRRRRKPKHPAPSAAVSRDGIKSRLMPGP